MYSMKFLGISFALRSLSAKSEDWSNFQMSKEFQTGSTFWQSSKAPHDASAGRLQGIKYLIPLADMVNYEPDDRDTHRRNHQDLFLKYHRVRHVDHFCS